MFLCLQKKTQNNVVTPQLKARFCSLAWSSNNHPCEEFKFTAYSLGAQVETHGKLILRTLSYLTVNSQDESHCELGLSLL